MEIYIGGRRNGKTYKAIQLSAEKQMPIVCWNSHQLMKIKHMAYKTGTRIPEPILAENVRKKVIGNRRGLIIDDLDILLRRIFDDNVYYATMEDCTVSKLDDFRKAER